LALCRGRFQSNRPGQALLSPDSPSIHAIKLLQSFCFKLTCLSISNENILAYYKLSIRKIFNKIESADQPQSFPTLALCRGRALWQSNNRPGQALLLPDSPSIYFIKLLQSFCFKLTCLSISNENILAYYKSSIC